LSATTYDQLHTLYRTLLVFATVGAIILSVGLVQFVYFERPGEETGVKARILGVYEYDLATMKTTGPDRSEFPRSDVFAAVVDWSSVPSQLVVDARWYDTFGSMRGEVGPGHATDLSGESVVPVEVPPDLHFVLPGRYTFVVERLDATGVPVEVLARRFVLVDRS
jgi:hypothetical protein